MGLNNVRFKDLGIVPKNRGCQNSTIENPPIINKPRINPSNYTGKPADKLPAGSVAVKKYRLLAGLTQFELAKRSGLSIDTIRKWEQGNGDPARARIDSIFAICDVMGIAPEKIMFPDVEQEDK